MIKKLLMSLLFFNSIYAAEHCGHTPKDSHDIVINIEAPKENNADKDLKKMKIKLVTITAIVTAIITGATTVIVSLNSNSC